MTTTALGVVDVLEPTVPPLSVSRVFFAMGTAVTIAGDVDPAVLAEIRDAFEELEERFSLYRPDSEASRLARRELTLTKASPELREAYSLALQWRTDTDGAFTPHRPDGVIDLAGVVKALAIAVAGEILDAHGIDHWCVNAGGDLLARTSARPDALAGHGLEADLTVTGDLPDSPTGRGGAARATGVASAKPWVAGIVDPVDRGHLLTQFRLTHGHPALATSGIAERGDHVWRIGGWEAEADPFVQVSVAGPDILTADVLATAILSGGRFLLDKAVRTWPIEVIAASRSGEIWATDAFRG